MQVTQFEFTEAYFEYQTRLLQCVYTLSFSDAQPIRFTETVQFPEGQLQVLSDEVLKNSINALHIALGISYWKAYVPKQIFLPKITLTKAEAEFWNTLYTFGMGEFYFKNKLPFENAISFPYDETLTRNPETLPLAERSLVGIGGGKDSIVVAELLKGHNREFAAFLVENKRQVVSNEGLAELIGVPALPVKRTIDPQLAQLKDAYNGHVPISCMYAFLGVFAALLYNYKYIVVGNEQSANIGNVEYLGQMINHQWSKSFTFESMFRNYVSGSITPAVEYFSLLRPFTELTIVKEFVKYPQYFQSFTSCNRNFRMSEGVEIPATWCGKCPKCAFAFAMLAAYLDEDQVLGIFEKNVFDDASLVDLYKELLGLKNYKPFDCVGTPEEVQAAFYLANVSDRFSDSAAMRIFEEEVLKAGKYSPEVQKAAMERSQEHAIPASMLEVVAQV